MFSVELSSRLRAALNKQPRGRQGCIEVELRAEVLSNKGPKEEEEKRDEKEDEQGLEELFLRLSATLPCLVDVAF